MLGKLSAGVLRPLVSGAGAVALASTGCAGQLQRQFQQEYKCAETVRVTQLDRDRYEVSGCELTAVYDCSVEPCVAEGSEDVVDDSPAVEAGAGEPLPYEAPAKRLKLKDGTTIVNMSLQLDENTWLSLRASPEKVGELVQMSLRQVNGTQNVEACTLDWMINGQRVEAPKVTVAAKSPNASIRGNLSRATLRELGMAQQFALKACDMRWTFDREQLLEVRKFVEIYEEELAWQGDARSGGSRGLVAPVDGWPKWENLGVVPAAVAGPTMSGSQLFKLLSPSVFQLEVRAKGGGSQGSAVAVTASDLLTNCHVLEGARRVIVKKGSDEFIGTISRADPESDRCVVSVKVRALVPIKGVRAPQELEVGEPLFTLGSPNGLELTLGDGILSGFRDIDEHPFVQTTAPISPGSSGGGLFDARGNLVGITTAVLVGHERLNQSLNFAIPANSFFAP